MSSLPLPASVPKLTYFAIEGRGETARLAFHIAGVKFEDIRVEFKDWPTVKPTTPWGHLPFLEWEGRVIGQSNTINRLVGKFTGLYPTDIWEAARCDEVCHFQTLFEFSFQFW